MGNNCCECNNKNELDDGILGDKIKYNKEYKDNLLSSNNIDNNNTNSLNVNCIQTNNKTK